MQVNVLVELAALIASHCPVLLRGHWRLSATGLQQYWTASKCRLDRWARVLKTHAAICQGLPPSQAAAHWRDLRPVLEEILAGEVLTRVWTGAVCACERLQNTQEAEPVVRSVYIGHLEARNRALNLLVHGQTAGNEEAAVLNLLRRRAERWTDMLLAVVLLSEDVSELAYDSERAKQFTQDLRHEQRMNMSRFTWPILLTSLRAAFPHDAPPPSPNADLNERIAAGILSCLGPELFDSTGLFNSLWQLRLANTTTDTLIMLEDLLCLEEPTEMSPATPYRYPTTHVRRY